jgi:hypothetical protein
VGPRFGESEEARARLVELGDATQVFQALTGGSPFAGVGHPLRIAAVEALIAVRTFANAIARMAFMADEADLDKPGNEIEAGRSEFSTARGVHRPCSGLRQLAAPPAARARARHRRPTGAVRGVVRSRAASMP